MLARASSYKSLISEILIRFNQLQLHCILLRPLSVYSLVVELQQGCFLLCRRGKNRPIFSDIRQQGNFIYFFPPTRQKYACQDPLTITYTECGLRECSMWPFKSYNRCTDFQSFKYMYMYCLFKKCNLTLT